MGEARSRLLLVRSTDRLERVGAVVVIRGFRGAGDAGSGGDCKELVGRERSGKKEMGRERRRVTHSVVSELHRQRCSSLRTSTRLPFPRSPIFQPLLPSSSHRRLRSVRPPPSNRLRRRAASVHLLLRRRERAGEGGSLGVGPDRLAGSER